MRCWYFVVFVATVELLLAVASKGEVALDAVQKLGAAVERLLDVASKGEVALDALVKLSAV